MSKSKYYEINKEVNEFISRAKKKCLNTDSAESSDNVNKDIGFQNFQETVYEFGVPSTSSMDNLGEYSSDDSDDSDSDDSDNDSIISSKSELDDQIEQITICNIGNDIVQWSIENNITHKSANNLLDYLRKYHPNLPKDIRTLKKFDKPSTDIV